jgi:hypothetical protein
MSCTSTGFRTACGYWRTPSNFQRATVNSATYVLHCYLLAVLPLHTVLLRCKLQRSQIHCQNLAQRQSMQPFPRLAGDLLTPHKLQEVPEHAAQRAAATERMEEAERVDETECTQKMDSADKTEIAEIVSVQVSPPLGTQSHSSSARPAATAKCVVSLTVHSHSLQSGHHPTNTSGTATYTGDEGALSMVASHSDVKGSEISEGAEWGPTQALVGRGVTALGTDTAHSSPAIQALNRQLDRFRRRDRFLGEFEMLGRKHRRRGGECPPCTCPRHQSSLCH